MILGNLLRGNQAAGAVIAAVLCLDCNSQSSMSPSSGPPPVRVQFSSASGELFRSMLPASLSVSYGSVALYDFGVFAVDPNGRGWSASASLNGDQLSAQQATTLPVGSDGSGTARIQFSGAAAVVADSGTLQLAFNHGKVFATVDVNRKELSGTVSGDFVLTCWVPASQLPATSSSGGGTRSPGSEPLLLDERLETAKCLPLRALVTQ